MKLYVMPTKTKCNGSCDFCITDFRDLKGKQFLSIGNLEKGLEGLDLDKIEITGGGEPLLNPNITGIINKCAEKAFTQLYTNGGLAEKTDLGNLNVLCLSRAHYDNKRNQEIMGVEYDLESIQRRNLPIKFSLLLHRSGIDSVRGIKKYLDWAKEQDACKVVVRQMMPHNYSEKISDEFVVAYTLFRELNPRIFERVEEGAEFYWKGMDVSFKHSPCDCNEQIFLHPDGRVGKIE